VLIFSLAILSLITVLTYQLLRNVSVGYNFDKTMINREHAEMLALGGIKLAIAHLTIDKPVPNNKKLSNEEQQKKHKKEFGEFLERMLSNINRWQEYKLTKAIDGMDGIISLCIVCEEGKININKAFDFKAKEFKPEYKKLLGQLVTTAGNVRTNTLKNLTDFLKKRAKPLDDISELYEEKTLSVRKTFYEPPIRTEKQAYAKPNTDVTIQDLFTTWGDSEKVEALFLSDSMCGLLKFRRPMPYDAEKRKETIKNFIKNYNQNMDENSDEYWKAASQIYNPEIDFKAGNNKIFASKFEPKVYSVLSSGKVGNVEQRVLAILVKEKQKFDIVRVYWI
jgi:hypothetical protein